MRNLLLILSLLVGLNANAATTLTPGSFSQGGFVKNSAVPALTVATPNLSLRVGLVSGGGFTNGNFEAFRQQAADTGIYVVPANFNLSCENILMSSAAAGGLYYTFGRATASFTHNQVANPTGLQKWTQSGLVADGNFINTTARYAYDSFAKHLYWASGEYPLLQTDTTSGMTVYLDCILLPN